MSKKMSPTVEKCPRERKNVQDRHRKCPRDRKNVQDKHGGHSCLNWSQLWPVQHFETFNESSLFLPVKIDRDSENTRAATPWNRFAVKSFSHQLDVPFIAWLCSVIGFAVTAQIPRIHDFDSAKRKFLELNGIQRHSLAMAKLSIAHLFSTLLGFTTSPTCDG